MKHTATTTTTTPTNTTTNNNSHNTVYTCKNNTHYKMYSEIIDHFQNIFKYIKRKCQLNTASR